MEILPSLASRHHAGVGRQKEMVELTAAGLIPPQVQDQTDDDFHREGLMGIYKERYEVRIT
jgi:hypothetical protein